VSLQNNRPFAATTLLQPRVSVLVSASPRTSARTGAPPRAPRFLVVRDRQFAGSWGSLRAVCRPTRLHLYTSPVRLFRQTPVARFRFAGRALTISVLLHIAVFLLLPYVPSGTFPRLTPAEEVSTEPGKIYYHLTMMNLSRKLPRVTSGVSPGRPTGSSEAAATLPELGRSAAHPKITIVLRPPRPDNSQQTIYQSVSAPDLRIAMDLKLPNVVVGTSTPVPRPQFHFNPSGSKPIRARQKSDTAEPAPTLTASTNSSVIPVSELTSAQPRLPVAPPAPAAITQSHEALALAEGSLPSGKEGSALVIIGIDPSQTAPMLALPAGNRWAELSISPAGGDTASQRGAPGKAPISRNAGAGSEGSAGPGVGRGESGGGAGNAGGVGILSIAGGIGENSGALDPMLPADMVYAVPASVLPRKNSLVVSAGPMGGGGLDVYGALHCGKIYTIFLQMPGKSWTLQFCQAKPETPTNAISRQSTVVRLEQGLLPPDPELRFDFRRLPLPPENAHKLILLKGLIREDGTVDLVKVYRSLLPSMDEAACLAFSRWKFKPAIREGHPVSVEILVGIPSDAPVPRAVH
jgi:Gram-negative bacterial TonB protein C-terminal